MSNSINEHINEEKVPEWATLESQIEDIKDDFDQYFLYINEYWKEHEVPFSDDDTSLPALYHGTHLSALTGIRLRGLHPIKEMRKRGKKWSAVYGTINPHSAANHILQHSNFDTFLKEKPEYSQKSVYESDPPIVLKIDLDAYFKEQLPFFKRLTIALRNIWLGCPHLNIDKVIDRTKYSQQYMSSSIDVMGIEIASGSEFVPTKYIKVLAFGVLDRNKNGVIEEITLDEAYQRLLSQETSLDNQIRQRT